MLINGREARRLLADDIVLATDVYEDGEALGDCLGYDVGAVIGSRNGDGYRFRFIDDDTTAETMRQAALILELEGENRDLALKLTVKTDEANRLQGFLQEEKAKFQKAAETLGVIQFAMNTLKVG